MDVNDDGVLDFFGNPADEMSDHFLRLPPAMLIMITRMIMAPSTPRDTHIGQSSGSVCASSGLVPWSEDSQPASFSSAQTTSGSPEVPSCSIVPASGQSSARHSSATFSLASSTGLDALSSEPGFGTSSVLRPEPIAASSTLVIVLGSSSAKVGRLVAQLRLSIRVMAKNIIFFIILL